MADGLIDTEMLADAVCADRAWYLIYQDHVKVGIVVGEMTMTVDVPLLQVNWKRRDGTQLDYLVDEFRMVRDVQKTDS